MAICTTGVCKAHVFAPPEPSKKVNVGLFDCYASDRVITSFCNACRLMMVTSLDIYSFGMVALFLFSERNYWSSVSAPKSPDIPAREQRVEALIQNIERKAGLQEIAQQMREMLDSDPTLRPTEATDCFFEVHPTHQDV